MKRLFSPIPLLLFVSFLHSGPNQNAIISIDLLPPSPSVDTVDFRPANDTAFWVAVRVAQAQGLDSYGFELSYDRTRLDYLQTVAALPGQGLFNFLESAGGLSAGFVGQLSRNDSSKVSIANALAGSDSAKSPNGGGILALVQFRPKGVQGDAIFAPGAAQFLDWRLTVDTGMAMRGARLVLQMPVALRFVSRRGYVLPDATAIFHRFGRDVLGRQSSSFFP